MTELLLVVAALSGTSAAPQACTAAATAPALDHVIVVVGDLERASPGFRELGFRLKPGRLHRNNLLNRHVKFRDRTSIELMTVRGVPGDAMARDYAELLQAGEGGVYVALTVPTLAPAERAVEALQLETRHSTSGSWQFVSFPPGSPAAAVFFSAGAGGVRDPDSLVSHRPDVVGLSEAWLEGGTELVTLLERLGAKRCGTTRGPNGRVGERWGLSRGSVVIVTPRAGIRHRVLGVVLQLRAPGERTVQPHPQFWVHYRFERR